MLAGGVTQVLPSCVFLNVAAALFTMCITGDTWLQMLQPALVAAVAACGGWSVTTCCCCTKGFAVVWTGLRRMVRRAGNRAMVCQYAPHSSCRTLQPVNAVRQQLMHVQRFLTAWLPVVSM